MHVLKMQACGNDFCVISFEEGTDYPSLAKRICDRRLGIGADGILVLKLSPSFELLCYNADGSRASMCANGVICFAQYALDNDLLRRGKLDVLTNDGIKHVEMISAIPFSCKIALGLPVFTNQMLYITDPIDSFGRVLKLHDKTVTIYSLYMGTINTIVFVDDFEENTLSYAEEISTHPIFHRQTNVNFVKVINKNEIVIKCYEKGVGFTLASGTGAASSAVACERLGFTGKEVKVQLELGSYQINITKKEIFMIGSASKVFECEYKEEK